ncbi:unnamed protein product, partial [Laminaria digitata]
NRQRRQKRPAQGQAPPSNTNPVAQSPGLKSSPKASPAVPAASPAAVAAIPLPSGFSPAAASGGPGAVAVAGAATAAPVHPTLQSDNKLFLHCQAFGAGFCAANECKLVHDAYRAEEERASWVAGNLPNVVGWGHMEAVIARPGSGGALPGAAPGVPPVLLIA